MATEKIQELADEYNIPTEVVEEYIEYMGFEPDEVDDLNYYGSFKNESDFAEQLVDEGIITDLGRYLYMTSTDMHLLAGEEADNRIENMDDQEILDETDDNYTPEEIDEAREYLRDKYYDEIHDELESDAVEYFVDNFGYEEKDLAKQSIFRVDYDKLGDDLQYDYNYIEHDGMVYVFNNYKRGGMTYRGGGIVTDLNDAFASDELKDLLNSRMKQGDPIVAFAYTDYGGDFFDKVAIEYFKENHPENIVVERTAYNGQNGIVFGEPASEFLEAYESYLLGYEDMENFYYQMENEETEDSFEFFLRDLSNYGGYKVSDRAMDWLMENKGGHYSMTTQGLDFSSSELEQELLEEGLIKKDDDDDDDDDSTDEENYGKGGLTEHGLRAGDKILSGKTIGTTIRVRNENFDEDARVDLETGKRTILKYNSKTKKWEDKMVSGGVTFDDKVQSISKSLLERKKVSPSVQKDYGKTYSKSEAIDSAKRIAGAMRKKEMTKKKS